MTTFTAWLATQTHRADPIAMLARIAAEDPAWPDSGHFALFRWHLEQSGQPRATVDALRRAWNLYIRSTPATR